MYTQICNNIFDIALSPELYIVELKSSKLKLVRNELRYGAFFKILNRGGNTVDIKALYILQMKIK